MSFMSIAMAKTGESVETTNMNQFFDQPQKMHGHARGPAPLSIGPGVEKSADLLQIHVEKVRVRPESRLVYHTDPHSSGADRFRYLRMVLQELWTAGKVRSLLITSALPGDGKSTIALNLATALADGGKRSVLLIEADLHRPTLGLQLGLPAREGLSECLETGLHPLSAIRRIEPLGWYFLPAGQPDMNPTELLQAEAFGGVMKTVSPLFDWVLIDSPPVTPLTDALSLTRLCSATLMVAREGVTPQRTIKKAIALLGRQRVLGVVLNGVEGLDRLYSGYYGNKDLRIEAQLKNRAATRVIDATSFINGPQSRW
jgi:polysaccharide biosynthesis transport protein